MTMMFRTIKSNIETILGTAEAGRYITLGYQGQSLSSDSLKDNLRHVMVRYAKGSFPKSSGMNTSTVMHDANFNIVLQASKNASVDVSVLEDPASTASDRAAALAAVNKAGDLAEQALDEFIDIIYNILMDARNYDMGGNVGDVSNRWIEDIQKGVPEKIGEAFVVTASLTLSMRIAETITGDTSGVDGAVIETDLVHKDDVETLAGVKTDTLT